MRLTSAAIASAPPAPPATAEEQEYAVARGMADSAAKLLRDRGHTVCVFLADQPVPRGNIFF